MNRNTDFNTADALSELIKSARKANETREDYDLFGEIVSLAMKAFDMSEVEFAEELQVSPASIRRYVDGKNAPHPAMRRVVYERLENRLREIEERNR